MYKHVIIRSDGDGHKYVIPFELEEEFDKWLNEAEESDDYIKFEAVFLEYMCGGDPFSEYDFYIKEN